MQVFFRQEECIACGNTWTPRVANPKQCPECKSTKWQGDLHTCPSCHKQWNRSGGPSCPSCHHNVQAPPPSLTCRKCNYTWPPRSTQVRQCPSCKSKNWNEGDIAA